MPVSWSQFCKEPLPERNFTFWEWFYAIMKVTREHLRAPWNDRCVVLGELPHLSLQAEVETKTKKETKKTYLSSSHTCLLIMHANGFNYS